MDSNNAGSSVFSKTVFRSVTVMQIIAMCAAAVIGIAVLCVGGFGGSAIGWLIVAVVIYMIPHFFGVKPKAKAGFALIFAVVAIVVGGAVVGPSFVDNNSRESVSDHGAFSDVSYVYDDSAKTITVDADFDMTGYDGDTIYLCYAKVTLVPFNSSPQIESLKNIPLDSTHISGSHLQYTLTGSDFDMSELYNLVLAIGKTDENGDVVYDGDSASIATLTGFTGAGCSSQCYTGAAVVMLYVLFIFFLILVFSTLLRRTISGKRKKMENDGRLYPQGYGRCDKCGALVLPGEIKCRKCGAYIDRPEEMRRKKDDFFQCSACGAEVPGDAQVCPKCGAKFDGVENVVSHIDGKVDVSEESYPCPKCGEMVPKNAVFCPKCGKKF